MDFAARIVLFPEEHPGNPQQPLSFCYVGLDKSNIELYLNGNCFITKEMNIYY